MGETIYCNNAKGFATLTESIIAYRKSDSLNDIKEPRNEKSDSIYSNPDNDPRGVWTSVSYVNPATKLQRPNLSYNLINPFTGDVITHPTNAWKYSEKVYHSHVSNNKLYWGKEGENTYPRLKKFLSEMDGGMVPVDLWKHSDTGTTDQGSKELEKLLGGKYFEFPKPFSLVKRVFSLITGNENNGIYLDFFSGSSPSAQAIMELNKEDILKGDNGNRKYILVQLPEPTEEKSEARKAGYATIADIGKERIRRVGNKIREELREAGKEELIDELDLGFKVFKLDSSNIHTWSTAPEDLEQNLFRDEVIKEERSAEDVLYEILLKYGLDLSLPIEEAVVDGKQVFSVGAGQLLVCLDDGITRDTAHALIRYAQEDEIINTKVVFKDAGFVSDVEKTNVYQVLKSHGIENVKTI